jgi:hypothetical protein
MDRTVHHDWLGLQLEHKITEGLYQRRSADTDKSGYYSAQVGILKQDMVTLTILRFIRNVSLSFVYLHSDKYPGLRSSSLHRHLGPSSI